MTGPKENSEFCFVSGSIEGEGKQNSLFPTGPVIKCFAIHVPPNSKLDKTVKEPFNLCGLAHRFVMVSDHLRVESLCCCLP